jgi:hypothetical protein
VRRRRQFKFPLETRTSRSEVLSFLTCHNILITLFWAAACFINVFYTLDTFISWLRTPYRVARKRRILTAPEKTPHAKGPESACLGPSPRACRLRPPHRLQKEIKRKR